MRITLKQLRAIFGFFFLVIFVALTTVLLVGYGQGYVYDRDAGEIRGGGLAVIDSRPSGAEIWLNGDHEGSTVDRSRLPAGNHSLWLEYDGYRNWSRDFEVNESEVIDIEYPLMIPERVLTTPGIRMDESAEITVSTDREMVAMALTNPFPHVRVFPSSDPFEHEVVLVLAVQSPDIVDMQWSAGRSRLLVTTENATGHEHLLVRVNDESPAVNLEAAFGNVYEEVAFTVSPNQLLASNQESISRLIIDEREERQLVPGEITSFAHVGDTVYALRHMNDRSEIIAAGEDDTPETIIDYQDRRDIDIAAATSGGRIDLVLHDKDRNQVTLLQNPNSATPRTRTFPGGVAEYMSLSPNQRMVFMSAGEHFRVYDRRSERTHSFTLESTPRVEPVWINSQYLAVVAGGELTMFDFDGSNIDYLARAGDGLVFADADIEAVYSLRESETNDNVMRLQRSELVR